MNFRRCTFQLQQLNNLRHFEEKNVNGDVAQNCQNTESRIFSNISSLKTLAIKLNANTMTLFICL